jgi:hypothetical protein
VRTDGVVVGAEGVELALELGDRAGRALAGQEALEGLVEPLDLAAGLGVVGAGVHVSDPEPVALELEQAPSPARGRREHGAVVGQQARREPVGPSGGVEARQDVGGLEHASGIRAHQEPGVVVEGVQDLDLGAVAEPPVGDVGLPALVGHLGAEPDPRAAGSLLRLGGDEPPAVEDPPDRGPGGQPLTEMTTPEVDLDRRGPGVDPEVGQLLAQTDDLVLELVGGPAWARSRPP